MILEYFSNNIRAALQKQEFRELYPNIEEIRLRVNKPIILKTNMNNIILKYIVKIEDILEALERICENSIYAYQNQISNGFITVRGGHRVGIAGTTVIENGKVINIKYIQGLNFRIAREIIGVSDNMMKYIVNTNTDIHNTLIVSPPGAGKTTLLRDIVRNISDGIENINFAGCKVGVVDERGEIAAMYKGMPQNNIGIQTDVMENIPKPLGMRMLIRSMSPEVIACDEIGSKEDIDAIIYAVCSGVKGIFTAHGASFNDLNNNPEIKNLINKNIIDRIIFLDKKMQKGHISDIYSLVNNQYIRKNAV